MSVALGLPGRAPLLYLLGVEERAGGLRASGFIVRYPLARARVLRLMTKTENGWRVQRGAARYRVPRLPRPGHFLTQPLDLSSKESHV